ncbi:MAG: CDP-glycerol glycerophosphotransferase family protein [Candidatus Diapherotrites archaeon]|nr:CDP-glycerol glycerophosphotransferase family protein [Candidatus Diapherotrites archaeon]
MNDKNIHYLLKQLYLGLLNREPDEDGLSFYEKTLLNGKEIKDVIQNIINSPEFFVKFLHPALLNQVEEIVLKTKTISLNANCLREVFHIIANNTSTFFNFLMLFSRENANVLNNKLCISFIYLEKKEKDSMIDVFEIMKERIDSSKIFIQLLHFKDFLSSALVNTFMRNIYIVASFDLIRLLYLIKPKNSELIMMDHGVGSMKKVTYREDILSCCDYYLVGGKIKEQRIINVCPQLKGKTFVVGFPKLKHKSITEDEKIDYCKRTGLDYRKPIILFAPTWTSNKDRGIWLIEKLSEIPNLFAIPHDTNYLEGKHLKEKGYPIYLLNENETISEHYPFVDILITDISSTAVEFAKLGKPVICLLQDSYSGFDSKWISPSGIPYIPYTNYEWKLCEVCKIDNIKQTIEKILSGNYQINTELVNQLCDSYGEESINKTINILHQIIKKQKKRWLWKIKITQ